MIKPMTESPTSDPNRKLDDEVAGCAAAHQRLLALLDAAIESATLVPSQPSLLPNWSVGHVLTHLARNADAIKNMLDGAAAGEERNMYPSADARDADIEAGSTRDAQALVDDVRKSCWGVESSWARLSADAWSRHGIARGNRMPVRLFPGLRWREVEVHTADLGIGFGPADWSAAFVAQDLATQLAEWSAQGQPLPEDVAGAQPWQQLAWFLGRDGGVSSPAPPWR